LTIDGAFPGAPVMLNHFLTANDSISYAAAGASLAQLITGEGTLDDPGDGTLSAAGIYASVTPGGLAIISTQGVALSISASVGTGSEAINIGPPSAPFTWAPTTTPLYTLGEDDYIVQESSVGTYLGVTPGGPALRMGAGPITGGFTDDPVHIIRSTPADAMNMVQLETNDRGMSYNPSVTEAFDQGSIDLYGIRRDTSVKARAVVDPYYVATVAAQLILQRQLLYRNTYSFQLGWKYILLEPMDLVQITDPRLGAQAITVRIISIEEDDEGTLSVTAEDWFGTPGPVMYPPPTAISAFGGIAALGSGGGTATPFPKQGGSSTASSPNFGQIAPSINTPFILEPTAQLLAAQGQTSPYIIVGLCGGPAATYDPNWGGANVYVSLDGSSFAPFGEFIGRSTMGIVTSDCPATGTTLAVDLTESHGQLNSVSAQLALNKVSLCAVRTPDGLLELLSYATATMVGANQYSLTGLFRGLYGTFSIDLPPGSQFLSLGSGSFFLEVLPSQFVGQVTYFEFPSFNLVGGGGQSLADTTIYSYVPTGASLIPGTFPVAVIKDDRMPAEVASRTTGGASVFPVE
jgi:Putative phage tail protein